MAVSGSRSINTGSSSTRVGAECTAALQHEGYLRERWPGLNTIGPTASQGSRTSNSNKEYLLTDAPARYCRNFPWSYSSVAEVDQHGAEQEKLLD
jgi:hypothetical protein